VHFLLQGEFVSAWNMNPMLLLVGVPTMLFFGVQEAAILVMGRRVSIFRLPAAMGWVLAGVFVLWFIVRNLPMETGWPIRPSEASTTHLLGLMAIAPIMMINREVGG
jgi:hypothetical protein